MMERVYVVEVPPIGVSETRKTEVVVTVAETVAVVTSRISVQRVSALLETRSEATEETDGNVQVPRVSKGNTNRTGRSALFHKRIPLDKGHNNGEAKK
jgi:hypothetical protein